MAPQVLQEDVLHLCRRRATHQGQVAEVDGGWTRLQVGVAQAPDGAGWHVHLDVPATVGGCPEPCQVVDRGDVGGAALDRLAEASQLTRRGRRDGGGSVFGSGGMPTSDGMVTESSSARVVVLGDPAAGGLGAALDDPLVPGSSSIFFTDDGSPYAAHTWQRYGVACLATEVGRQ